MNNIMDETNLDNIHLTFIEFNNHKMKCNKKMVNISYDQFHIFDCVLMYFLVYTNCMKKKPKKRK